MDALTLTMRIKVAVLETLNLHFKLSVLLTLFSIFKLLWHKLMVTSIHLSTDLTCKHHLTASILAEYSRPADAL